MIKKWITVNIPALSAVCWWDVLIMDKSPVVTILAWLLIVAIFGFVILIFRFNLKT